MMALGMAYSDKIVKPIALELSKGDKRVTFRMIAEITDIPVTTIRDSIKRLLETGHLERVGGGKRWGYTYHEPEQ